MCVPEKYHQTAKLPPCNVSTIAKKCFSKIVIKKKKTDNEPRKHEEKSFKAL